VWGQDEIFRATIRERVLACDAPSVAPEAIGEVEGFQAEMAKPEIPEEDEKQ
jgi:hypothetical protein